MLAKPNIKIEMREFLKLAVPLASAQVAQAIVGFVDTLMMGQLGAESLAAGGLASTTFQLLLNIASGIVIAVSPLVAIAYGGGHKTQIEQIARQGLWLSLLLGIPMMFLIGHLDAVMVHLGQAKTTVALADGYLNLILWGIFPALGFAMLRSYVSALSQARPVMVIVFLGTLVNVTGNYVLGYGKLGFPRMELAGLGLASGLSFWVMFLILLVYTLKHEQLKHYRFLQGFHRLKPHIIQQLLRTGVPIAVTIALEYGLFAVVTYLMGMLGTEALAAHQIVFQTMLVIFMVPLGMSYAVTARVGQWLGQQHLAGARLAGYIGGSMAFLFMALTAIALLTYRQQVIAMYLDIRDPQNASIIKLALPIIIIAAIAQPLDGVQKTAMGALYGLQDTRVPMLLSVLAFWGVGLPSGYLLGFRFGFGSVGLWIGQSIGVAIAGIIFLGRFHQLTSRTFKSSSSPDLPTM
ncbi:MATE efflux family protein [Gloeocapsa sp. PCC 7428]|uniref:MATE family efflux transporter n=1 Tax=Gloeocapsa sp. PCC 7428 TaxID=1173026 RepID=UPI0002A5EE08|nr:MATE family efflux transporter [Gloeocapsa sp. PCC 7428]AFZ32299.1 MATE efflux family protein [Gloeocapsa sp. PCC 7428]